MSRRNRAFCPSCGQQVLVDLMYAGEGVGNVQVCANCDNAMLYDSRRDWEEDERRRVRRMQECGESYKERPGVQGHHYVNRGGRRKNHGECEYCGLPEGMTPLETLPEGVSMDDDEEGSDPIEA